MTTITLHGEMARIFGRTWKLAVSTPAEALRAIEANKPGLIAYLGEAEARGIGFRIRVGKEVMTNPELVNFASRGRRIQITPVVQGAKSKYLGIIIGVALIALTWGAGTIWAQTGFGNAMAAGAFGVKGMAWAHVVGGIGISMAIGGAAQLLAGTPKAAQADTTKSFGFQGPANVSAQGGPVPICYGGPLVVGSVRISASVISEDRPGRLAANQTNPGSYTGGGGFTPAVIPAGGGEPAYYDGATGEGPFTRYPVYAEA